MIREQLCHLHCAGRGKHHALGCPERLQMASPAQVRERKILSPRPPRCVLLFFTPGWHQSLCSWSWLGWHHQLPWSGAAGPGVPPANPSLCDAQARDCTPWSPAHSGQQRLPAQTKPLISAEQPNRQDFKIKRERRENHA